MAVPPIDDILSSIRSVPGPSAPAQKSSEALAALSAMIASLDKDFSAELLVKTESLDRIRNQLRLATRELSDQRKQVSEWKLKASEVNAQNLRIRNLERALLEEDSFDWTGRSEIDGAPSHVTAGAAFTYRGPGSTLSNLPLGIAIEFDADPPLPLTDTEPNSLVHLIRLETWYNRVTELLSQRIEKLDQINHLQEGRLLKIVAGCCSVEPEKITENFLDDLLLAVDSDGTSLDLGRVATFLGKVRGGVWI